MNRAIIPNRKSKVIIVALLFHFGQASGAAFLALPDTIIIDGEYIYIEKDEVITDVDSLQDVMSEDVKKEKIKREYGCINWIIGANVTSATYHSSTQSQQPLDVFMGRKKSLAANAQTGFDFGLHLYSWRLPGGEKRLSLHGGLVLNQIKINSTQFTDESQLNQDSIINFYRNGDKLILEYFFYTSFPFGEVDTVEVSLKQTQTVIKTFDLPLRLRWTQGMMGKKWSWLAEAGLQYRIIWSKAELQDNYTLADNALYTKLNKADMQLSNQMFGIVGAGIKYYFNDRYNASMKWHKRTTLTMMATALLPAWPVNANQQFYFQSRTFGLSCSLGWFF